MAPNFALALLAWKYARQAPSVDLLSLRQIINGGEPIDAAVTRAFLDALAPVGLDPSAMHPAWGMAESTVLIASSAGGMIERNLDARALEYQRVAIAPQGGRDASIVSTGTPIPTTSVSVRDEDGRDLRDGSVGELHVCGPSLMSGYFSGGVLDTSPLADGWFATGDLGFVFEGEVHLTGRANDVIIVAGRNLSPERIERVLARVPGVRQGRVVAVPIGRAGTQQLGIVVEGNLAIGADAIRRFCNEGMGVVPSHVINVKVGTVPRTTSGKVRRAATAALVADLLGA